MTTRNSIGGFLVPRRPLRDTLTVARSRFVTSIRRADNAATARAGLAEIRAEMPDASHHVHAFRIGFGKSVTEGMSDDGEPSGTAGPPVLAVLRGTEVGDVLVVVTRYFGGTKLGTGGLVRAYSEAARRGLALLETERKIERVTLGFDIPYTLFEQSKRLVAQHSGEISETQFDSVVTVYLRLPAENRDAFCAALADLSAGRSEAILLS